MKLTKRKRRKPTWASDNNPKVHKKWGLGPKAAIERTKRNNKIARILKQHGWEFTEGWGMTTGFEDYYSLHFRKPTPGVVNSPDFKVRTNLHPFVYFNFKWSNQGGPEFMEAEMYSFYNYSPNENYMRPSAQFEIKYITEQHLHLLDNMFNGVVAGIKSQSPSYGKNNDTN